MSVWLIVIGIVVELSLVAVQETNGQSDTQHKDKNSNQKPSKDHNYDHYLPMIFLIPPLNLSERVVQNETDCPTPEALNKETVWTTEGCKEALPILHLQQHCNDANTHHVNQQSMHHYVHFFTAVEMPLQEEKFDSQKEHKHYVLHIFWQPL